MGEQARRVGQRPAIPIGVGESGRDASDVEPDEVDNGRRRMPRICSFYGIVIAMFHNDHPPAHFTRLAPETSIRVGIDTLQIISGSLPRRAQAMVLEWATLHQAELASCWERAHAHQPMGTIAPLP